MVLQLVMLAKHRWREATLASRGGRGRRGLLRVVLATRRASASRAAVEMMVPSVVRRSAVGGDKGEAAGGAVMGRVRRLGVSRGVAWMAGRFPERCGSAGRS